MILTCPQRVLCKYSEFLLLALLVGPFCPDVSFAVHPFVTDDARIVYKGQVGTETYGGVTMANGDKSAFEIRSLQGIGLTDRFELTAGGFGFTYQDHQARPLDMLIQPGFRS